MAQSLTTLRAGLRSALPHRVVSEAYVDFAKRRREELIQGVISVVMPRIDPNDDWTARARLSIIGQIEMPKEQDSAAGEAAEIRLAGEIRAFLRNAGQGVPHIEVKKIGLSAQLEHPFHWCMFECEMGLVDETEGLSSNDLQLYPPNVDPHILGGVDVNIDLDPHESRAQHDAWLAGDETPTPPDLKLTVELNK